MQPAHEIRPIHPQNGSPGIPEAAHHHADHGGFDDEVVLVVDIAVERRTRAELAGGERVHAAAGAHDQPVHDAEAADRDKGIDDRADDVAEDLGKRDAGQRLAQRPGADDGLHVADRAHRKDVQTVEHRAEQRAEDQRDRQIALGVLELGVDRGRDDPALIGEGKGRHAREHARKRRLARRGGGVFRGIDIVQHPRRRAGGKSDDDADDRHQHQRDELDDRHADLQLAGQLGAQDIDAVADHQKARAEAQRLGADRAGDEEVHGRDAAQLTEKHGREKGQHRREAGIIDRRHEPADVIRIIFAQRDLGIVDDAVDLFELGAQLGKHKRADDADDAYERHDQHALEHVAVCQRQHLAALDEDAGADDDTDDHRDRGRQSVALFHCAVVHSVSLLRKMIPTE